MEKIVIDTNVLVSSLIQPGGTSAKVMSIIFSNENIDVCYSAEILNEYIDVLSRAKFQRYNFDMDEIRALIDDIVEFGELVEPSKSDINFHDESDRVFYDVARAVGATLITGNTKHYPLESFIVTPQEYLRLKKLERDSLFFQHGQEKEQELVT